ncbi:MAG TPA: enoyl-CoA hydratase-related protein [Ignavibacteriaceae bacterium]|nr:enoyl-CoA hydratase-related protein [Ignavibacteriaceae bacterium]
MSYQNLLIETKGSLTIVKINRPDKLNALNDLTINELNDVFNSIKNDDSIKAVIITGSGEKAFVAGADISELHMLNMISARSFAEKGQSVYNLIESMDKPVIAAVNGFALGGGCELALACHIRLASENARFGQPEVNLGLIPGYGGTQRLARLINPGRTMEYILTGDMIDASEAFRIGLVNHIYPQAELMAKAEEMANKIISKARHAVRFAVKAVTATKEISQREGLNYEASLFALCCGTEDFKEGTSAFLEKRKADFKDR